MKSTIWGGTLKQPKSILIWKVYTGLFTDQVKRKKRNITDLVIITGIMTPPQSFDIIVNKSFSHCFMEQYIKVLH